MTRIYAGGESDVCAAQRAQLADAQTTQSEGGDDRAPERRLWSLQMPALFGIGSGIDIPAGQKDFTIEDSITLPVDVRAFSIAGHAHYIAKEMKATATLPDGSTLPLLWIPDWDFAWQDRYRYKDPVELPKGTRIDAEISYDNTAENPHQPSNPPKEVWWGEGSFDEMGSVSMQGVCVRKEDEPILANALRASARTASCVGSRSGAIFTTMGRAVGISSRMVRTSRRTFSRCCGRCSSRKPGVLGEERLSTQPSAQRPTRR